MVTCAELLTQAAPRLAEESARLDAELILANTLKVGREALYRDPDRMIDDTAESAFDEAITLRAKGVPLAYILGRTEFWSLELAVDENVLIPRPETELLVELSLHKLASLTHPTCADLGTGSGAVALALASERPDCTIIAVEQSAAAITVARTNVLRHEASRVRLVGGDWCQALDGNTFDVIVANPPYVAKAERQRLSAGVHFEPEAALFAEDSGYAALEKIINDARRCLKPAGVLYLEHGDRQGAGVRRKLAAYGYTNIETKRDLNNLERVSSGLHLS
ncbi:MAG: peptide chain release factor N(5)-glutamine methyltransferase [Pseudomonadota bacterium]